MPTRRQLRTVIFPGATVSRGTREVFTVETGADSAFSLLGLSFEAADQDGSVLFHLDPGRQEETELDFGSLTAVNFATAGTGKMFTIANDGVIYGMWFNTGTETVPGIGADVFEEVAVSLGQTTNDIRSATASELQSLGFEIVSEANAVLTVRSPVRKSETDADAGDTGISVSVTVAGVDAAPTPPPGWDRVVSVFFEENDADTVMASRIVTALAGDSGFTASANGNIVTATNQFTGARTDAADVSSGFTLTTTQQGTDP